MFTLHQYQILIHGLDSGSFFPEKEGLVDRLKEVAALKRKLTRISDPATALVPLVRLEARNTGIPPADLIRIFETERELIASLTLIGSSGRPIDVAVYCPANSAISRRLYDKMAECLTISGLKEKNSGKLHLIFESGLRVMFVSDIEHYRGSSFNWILVYNKEYGE